MYSGRGTPEFRESGSVDLLILSLEPVHCRTQDHLETDTSSPCKTILGSFLASDINDVTTPVQGIVPFFNGSHTISARLPPTRGQSGRTECAEGHIALSCLRLSNSIRPCRCFLVPFLLKQILQLCSVCWRCVLGALGGSCSCTRNDVGITTLYCFVAFFVLSFFSMLFDLNYWKYHGDTASNRNFNISLFSFSLSRSCFNIQLEVVLLVAALTNARNTVVHNILFHQLHISRLFTLTSVNWIRLVGVRHQVQSVVRASRLFSQFNFKLHIGAGLQHKHVQLTLPGEIFPEWQLTAPCWWWCA